MACYVGWIFGKAAPGATLRLVVGVGRGREGPSLNGGAVLLGEHSLKTLDFAKSPWDALQR